MFMQAIAFVLALASVIVEAVDAAQRRSLVSLGIALAVTALIVQFTVAGAQITIGG